MPNLPIKVGIIGLSRSKGWATVAHLPYLKQSSKYKIVAIANSSVESARNAIETYELPKDTKAYGNTQDLAQDPNVDLIVNTVRVDKHLPTIAPALKAGKSVYVEWPLGRNLAEAEQLLALAKDNNVQIAEVGLQGRQSPVVQTLKQLVEDGRVGKILNSTLVAAVSDFSHKQVEHLAYLNDREVGGNMINIHLAHIIDAVETVLGYGFETPPKSLLKTTRKTYRLTDADGKVIDPAAERTSPDFIALNGTLRSGTALSFTLQGTRPFKDVPALQWTLSGDTGEIRVTSGSAFLSIGSPNTTIQILDFESNEVEVLKLEDSGLEGLDLSLTARNVGRVYAAIAEGKVNASFEDAVERHRFLNALWKENGVDGM